MRVADDRLDGIEIDVTVQSAIDCDRWPERAVTEAENFVHFDGGAGRQLESLGVQAVGAAGLAGLRTAHLHDGTDRRRGAKVLVEADDSMHFGDREIEDIRQQRDARVIDVAEVMLDGMKRWHQPAGPLPERLYERVQLALGRNDIHGRDRTA